MIVQHVFLFCFIVFCSFLWMKKDECDILKSRFSNKWVDQIFCHYFNGFWYLNILAFLVIFSTTKYVYMYQNKPKKMQVKYTLNMKVNWVLKKFTTLWKLELTSWTQSCTCTHLTKLWQLQTTSRSLFQKEHCLVLYYNK